MISTTFDPEADAMYLRFAAQGTKVKETREVADGVMLDLDEQGRVIGIEVLHVSTRKDSPLPVAAE